MIIKILTKLTLRYFLQVGENLALFFTGKWGGSVLFFTGRRKPCVIFYR